MRKHPMFTDATIVIPSKGRPYNQVTVAQLPLALRAITHVAVPEDEAHKYKLKTLGVKVLPVPNTHNGIANTRAWLWQWCPTRFLFLLDDDMVFAHRPDMSKPTLKHLRELSPEITRMFQTWRAVGDKYVHVGLSARQGNNHTNSPLEENVRLYNAYLHDVHAMRRLDLEYARLPVMEDFDITLQLLRKGYANAMLYRWCWNQQGSNAVGGCSTYRTAKVQHAAATELARLHHPFVRVVQRASGNWQGMELRTDVEVQWQAAYESSHLITK